MLHTAPVEKAGLTTSLSTPQPPTSEKDHLHCDYCGKPRHTKETCWKLHGRPTRGRGGKRGTSRNQAKLAETVEEPFKETTTTEFLSPNELQSLKRLLSHIDTSSFSGATSNFVKSGNASSFNNVPWIIDSGANRHMTGFYKGFLNYSPSLTKDSVKIADGSFTPISGTGSVICTSNIKLSSVLHVPHFPVNLLSVSAITNALNCKIEFFPDHCVIQDLRTGKMIGNGRLHDGLYMLEGDPASSISQACFGENKDVNQEIIQ
ncbi:hypothetical protein MANES_08G119311v8 [Manihot esculenta]|uniref:Uncharacterized protein n=1 Tax=Manihot esculenta TaxID=3983 RepID=A0ACB7HFM7_MANES|nr:hypothetical protein MANES_08G119311v8 [Manihot esculenta]